MPVDRWAWTIWRARSIVFVAWDDEDLGSIRSINPNGRGERAVTGEPGHYSWPMFSPDGNKLVFGSNRNAAKPRATDIFIADWSEE